MDHTLTIVDANGDTEVADIATIDANRIQFVDEDGNNLTTDEVHLTIYNQDANTSVSESRDDIKVVNSAGEEPEQEQDSQEEQDNGYTKGASDS